MIERAWDYVVHRWLLRWCSEVWHVVVALGIVGVVGLVIILLGGREILAIGKSGFW